jgi:hypothetical protein
MFEDYKITKFEDDTVQCLNSADGNVVVHGKDSKLFTRVGIHITGEQVQEPVRVVVAELNGVRAYFNGETVVLTTDDLYL